MERNITIHKIKNRINEAEKGKLFILTDFLDLASYVSVKKTLSRLAASGEIIRIYRGIYKKSNFNDFLQCEVPVSPDNLAKAIARYNNWTIGPKGDAALNILGLSTQVPAVYRYISDGPYKKIEYEGITIVFTKRSNKDISGYSYKTILIIEAIRTLGPEHVNDQIRHHIAKKCNQEDLQLLNYDGKRSSRWIYQEIKKILEIGGYDYVGVGETFK
jgi:hypothetical protein